MTDRLLRALECPHLRILGHPTGRLLLQRDPYPFDFDRVAAEAVRRGVWLEINASPERLDLDGPLIRSAKAKGAQLHHFHRRAPPQASRQHALRRHDGAPRLAGGRRHPEYAAGGPFRRRAPDKIMKITSSTRSLQVQALPSNGRRSRRPQDRFRDQALRGAPCRLGRHDGGGRKKRILLVRQYRLPAGQYLWELPAGRLDPGEKPLQAAKRELTEETGYSARKWTQAGVVLGPSPGYVQERMTIFLATDLTEGEATPMDDERIETRWFKRKEVAEMIASGKIEDAKTMIGFLLWQKGR